MKTFETVDNAAPPPQNPFRTNHAPSEVAALFRAGQLLGEPSQPDDHLFADDGGNGCLSSSDFYQIYGATGSGKTLFTMGLASAVASGTDFIGWPCVKPRVVLYLDGELPERTMRKRLELASKLAPRERAVLEQNLVIVSRERLLMKWGVDLAPLDTPMGEAQVLWLADAVGAELVVLDSRFCLLNADMKEANSMPKSLILALRHRKKAQWWVHHSGKDAARGGYGDKTAEFLMDANICFEQVGPGEFQMFFSGEKGGKARNKEPGNAHFYEDVKLSFSDGVWVSSGAAAIPKAGSRRDADMSLTMKSLIKLGSNKSAAGLGRKVSREALKKELLLTGAYEPEDGKLSDTDKKAVNRAIKNHIDDGRLMGDEAHLWLPNP